MQMLCQTFKEQVAIKQRHRNYCRVLVSLLLWVLGSNVSAESLTPQEKMTRQAALWVKQSLQLSENQFSFAPLDARLRVLDCDRPLTMDLPFASKETVRVRCQTDRPWQLYLRVILTEGAAPAEPKTLEVKEASLRRVVVGTQLLRRGTVLTPALLSETDYSSQGLDSQAVSSIKDLENGEMVRDVAAGTPLRSHDVRRAILVKQGQSVLLTVTQGNGFSITARVDALQDGKMGDQIRLKNPESGRILSAVVTGPNTAKGQ